MAKKPEIPSLDRQRILLPSGKETWHGVTPTRFAVELPDSVKGPINARAYRAKRKPNAIAQDPFGTPQLPAEVPPKRD